MYIITSKVCSYECVTTFIACSFVCSYGVCDNVRLFARLFIVMNCLVRYVFVAFPRYIVTARRVRRTSLWIGFLRTLITARKPIIRLPVCNELSRLCPITTIYTYIYIYIYIYKHVFIGAILSEPHTDEMAPPENYVCLYRTSCRK